MISKELKRIIGEFSKNEKMSFLKPTTHNKVEAFEKEKQVILPSKYK